MSLDALFGRTCPTCGRTAAAVPCRGCRSALIAAPGLDLAGIGTVRSLFLYAGIGRELVRALKYGNQRGALPWLGASLAALAREHGSVDVVTWVPTSRSRAGKRGFDQGRLLALAVGESLRVPARRLVVRMGGAQTGRSADQRRAADLGLRARRAAAGAPGVVLLVDDVLTTGATVQGAARALHRVGVGRVAAVTVAQTPLKVGRPLTERIQ